MRLILISFALLFSSVLRAQELAPAADVESSEPVDTYVEDLYPEETTLEDSEGTPTAKVETDKIQVECVCPLQEEVAPEYIPSIFPPGTAVTIMPTPDPNTPTKVEIQERQYPAGYIEKLPSGYSSDSYRPIP